MEELTPDKVMQIHDYLIDELGGTPGIRDLATLSFLVESINREIDLCRKAALALFLADRHPFWDGQKRTAFVLADGILRENGYCFKKDKKEIMRVMVKIAEYRCPEVEEIDRLVKWVKKMAVRRE